MAEVRNSSSFLLYIYLLTNFAECLCSIKAFFVVSLHRVRASSRDLLLWHLCIFFHHCIFALIPSQNARRVCVFLLLSYTLSHRRSKRQKGWESTYIASCSLDLILGLLLHDHSVFRPSAYPSRFVLLSLHQISLRTQTHMILAEQLDGNGASFNVFVKKTILWLVNIYGYEGTERSEKSKWNCNYCTGPSWDSANGYLHGKIILLDAAWRERERELEGKRGQR